jgi:hypothetical protein
MDGVARSFGKLFLLVVSPLLSAVVGTECQAGGSCRHQGLCPFVDCCTVCAWHRTWHGPYALATPLRGYCIPRMAAGCCCNGYAGQCRGAIGDCYVSEWPVAEECLEGCCPEALMLEPQGFERLGQIPNDAAFSVDVASPAANRPGR